MRSSAASRRIVLALAGAAVAFGVGLAILWLGFGRGTGERDAPVPVLASPPTARAFELRDLEKAQAPARVAELAPAAPQASGNDEPEPTAAERASIELGQFILRGKVALRGASTLPVARPQVTIVLPRGEEGPHASDRAGWLSADVVLAEDGTFSQSIHRAGRWSVTASAPGHAAKTVNVAVGPKTPSPWVEIELVPAWNIEVRLVDAATGFALHVPGKPATVVDGLAPFVSSAAGSCVPRLGTEFDRACGPISMRGQRLTADEHGRWFRLTLETNEAAWVGATHGGTVVAVAFVPPVAQHVELAVDRDLIGAFAHSLALRIRSRQNGSVVADAVVTVFQAPAQPRRSTSDAAGEVTLADLATSSVDVRVEADGYRTRRLRLVATRGERDSEPETVLLDVERTISGRLLDPDGVGIRSNVQLVPVDGTVAEPGPSIVARSELDGSFTLRAPPGRYVVVDLATNKRNLTWIDCADVARMPEYACADTLYGSVDGLVLRRTVREVGGGRKN